MITLLVLDVSVGVSTEDCPREDNSGFTSVDEPTEVL